MELSFWHERWERAEIGFHQQEINVHLQQFWKLSICNPVSGCSSRCAARASTCYGWPGEGHPVTGVEISRIAVEAFFAENGLQPRRWREGAFEIWEQDEIRILLGDFFASGTAPSRRLRWRL